MGIALTTIGIEVSWAVETVKGKRPTEGYKVIDDIKEVPNLNPETDTLETTVLSETKIHTYVKGLKKLDESLNFKANYTQELIDEWEKVVQAYESGKSTGMQVWLQIAHPGLAKATFVQGEPVELGMPGSGVNTVYETDLRFIPSGQFLRETKVK